MSLSSISDLGSWAYAFVFTIVGLQSAGVPVPGTTALVAASLYAGTAHHLDIVALIAAATIGAGVGNAVGFALGWWGGWKLLKRYGGYAGLTPARLKVGRYLFDRHGRKVVFFGRFITGLRTWSAFLAGANRMRPSRFLLFSSLAALVWALETGLQYFYFGHLLDLLGTALTVALIALGAAATILGSVYLRRRGRGLERVAELALPGPLE